MGHTTEKPLISVTSQSLCLCSHNSWQYLSAYGPAYSFLHDFDLLEWKDQKQSETIPGLGQGTI